MPCRLRPCCRKNDNAKVYSRDRKRKMEKATWRAKQVHQVVQARAVPIHRPPVTKRGEQRQRRRCFSATTAATTATTMINTGKKMRFKASASLDTTISLITYRRWDNLLSRLPAKKRSGGPVQCAPEGASSAHGPFPARGARTIPFARAPPSSQTRKTEGSQRTRRRRRYGKMTGSPLLSSWRPAPRRFPACVSLWICVGKTSLLLSLSEQWRV